MKKWLLLVYAFVCSPLLAIEPLSLGEGGQELIVHNRVLAQVNGKAISVLDIVKRMDLFLQKHYPHLSDSKVARYQFFTSHWKEYLNQMIETELMILDATQLEIKISEAEIREEIMNRFGPNVMPTLDKLGISYEEARQMIHDEFVVQRISWFRVNAKAVSQVNTQDVKLAYKKHIEKHPESDEWVYQVLSIRTQDPVLGESVSQEIASSLPLASSLNSLSADLQKKYPDLAITLSSEIEANEQSLSASHRQVLRTLTPGSYSQPVTQISRSDGSTVHRVFFLKTHTIKTPPPFEKLADQLKNELLQEMAEKEHERYLKKLKQKMSYEDQRTWEQIPSDFQPFALR